MSALDVAEAARRRRSPRAARRRHGRKHAHRRARQPRAGSAGWTEAHVRRLFWRAGFGATPAEARRWAKRGKAATLDFVVNGAARRGEAAWAGATRGRPRARPAQRVGRQRPVVARSHDSHHASAAGEADAVLARPLRDVRAGHAADARAEQDAATPRARLVPRPARRRHARPGDAAVPVARGLDEGRPERELRARADGAVHARHRLLRARRARGGARADRLHRRLARQRHRHDPVRGRRARRRRQDAARKTRTVRRRRRARPRHRAPEPRAVPRRQAVELLRRDAAEPRDRARARRASTARTT